MRHPRPPARRPRGRRGTALVLVLLLTAALAALAASAIYLTSSGSIITKYLDREREFRYAAEAALAQGKARLTVDRALSDSLPDSGYVALVQDGTVTGADSVQLPGVLVSTYVGRTGNFTGQFGLFTSVVAVARDGSGARYVRRLELQAENFAKWAVFADYVPGGICYARGEVITGPFWANTSFAVCPPSWYGGRFTDYVGTTGVVNNKQYGEFVKTPLENQPRIDLPSLTRLERLRGYADAGKYTFNNGNNGMLSAIQTRLEFIALDMNGDGDNTDDDEGFFRVYSGSNPARTRVDISGANDFTTSTGVGRRQCGLLITTTSGRQGFVPWGAAAGQQAWLRTWLTDSTSLSTLVIDTLSGSAGASVRAWFNRPGRRCFPEGDPHLIWMNGSGAAAQQPGYGGADASTFVANPAGGGLGSWVSLTSQGLSPHADVTARYPALAEYLFPLSRKYNANYKGVIYFTGSVAIHGTLRGRVTIYTPKSIGFLDDLVYATSPAVLPKQCRDLFGVIAGVDAMVLLNGINFPVTPDGAGGAGQYLFMDDNNHWFFDGVVLAATGTHSVENFNGAPTAAQANNRCNGTDASGGCIFQHGGMIVKNLTATFTLPSGRGMAEARTYDTCMATQSPPYFPTTGRYLDNRFYEIDPVRFEVATLFARLTPSPDGSVSKKK